MFGSPHHGWQVQIIPTWRPDGDRVAIWRDLSEHRREILLVIDGHPTLRMLTAENDYALDNELLPIFPRGVLEAIAEHIKPGPSTAELAVLNDALALERARVDRILERRL